MTDTLLNCTMIFNHYDINCVLNSDSKKVDKLGNYKIFHSWFEIPKDLLILKKSIKYIRKQVSIGYPWVFCGHKKLLHFEVGKKPWKIIPLNCTYWNGDNICTCGASF